MSDQLCQDVVVVAAVRTPIGSFLGGLSSLTGHELGAKVIAEALARCALQPEHVSEVIMGQVLTAAQGQNPARQASHAAGIPFSVPALGVSMVCGSSLRAVMFGQNAIKTGESSVVVAGGQESMSRSQHSIHMRDGVKFGNKELVDTMIQDGLTDAFHNYHMGITAENVASRWNVSREDQDQFAYESQHKAAVALEEGHFQQEIVPISIVPARKGAEVKVVDKDEYPKTSTTVEGLAKLRPCFDKSGSVTAGNASGLNDGAAAVVLMSLAEARTRQTKVLCRIVSSATAGVSPDVMGTGPIPAVRQAVHKAGWTLDDVDLFELNEAFAAQALAVVRELKIQPNKVNVSGGAIALGHPIGASGCRVLVTLIHAMERLKVRRGCAALCVGGGMGVAICVEREQQEAQ